MKKHLSHFDSTGAAQMVDITEKKITTRTAIAKSVITMLPETLKLVEKGETRKGDVLGISRLAGIMAAKKTANLIPLCHPLPLSKIGIKFLINQSKSNIEIEATVKTAGRTGVEMEALTAVTVSSLTVYDMLKSIDKEMTIMKVQLIYKDGGKSGKYERKE